MSRRLGELPFHTARFSGATTLKEKQPGRKKKSFGSSTPTSSPTKYCLNLEDEIPVRAEDCNIP